LICVLSTRGRCGIQIKLDVDNHNRWSDHTIRREYFQFTDLPDQDAAKIKKIVSSFIREADLKVSFDEAKVIAAEQKDKARRAEAEMCCTRYKEIIEKVKPE
jgi:hypothetical protein